MPSRVLLTGGNGFIASHILHKLLEQGHSVRITVRTEQKGLQAVQDACKSDPGRKMRVDFVVVPDMEASGAFDAVVSSNEADSPFDAVIHTASPCHYTGTRGNKEDYIDPAVKGTREILTSIRRLAPSVKRVMFTSSYSAVWNPSIPYFGGHVYTEKDWNPITYEQAIASGPAMGYHASKTLAERTAWDFVNNDPRPNFDLVTMTPSMVYGPVAHSLRSMDELNSSNKGIYDRFMKSPANASVPWGGVPFYTDVRDLADAHIKAALSAPEAGGRRFLVVAGSISAQEVCDILRRHFPEELAERTPKGSPGSHGFPKGSATIDNSLSKGLLGQTYLSAEKTFVDMTRQFLDLEKATGERV